MASKPYVCSKCGAAECKLWRPYMSSRVELTCARCTLSAEKMFGAIVSDGKFFEAGLDGLDCGRDDIGFRVPAVPVLGEDAFWGYLAVPPDRVAWWRGLPTARGADGAPLSEVSRG